MATQIVIANKDAITIDNQGTGLLSLSSQAIAVNDVMVKNSGDTMTGQLVLSGTSGSSGTTALSITGGNSSASNAAVSITGHLEASTKSFNIPHPLLENKSIESSLALNNNLLESIITCLSL